MEMGRTCLLPSILSLLLCGCSPQYQFLDEPPSPSDFQGEWIILPNGLVNKESKMEIHGETVIYLDFPLFDAMRNGDSSAPIIYTSGQTELEIRSQPSGYGFEIKGNQVALVEEKSGELRLMQTPSPFLNHVIFYKRTNE